MEPIVNYNINIRHQIKRETQRGLKCLELIIVIMMSRFLQCPQKQVAKNSSSEALNQKKIDSVPLFHITIQ